MATTNVTATLSRAELFEAFRGQVDPALHDVLHKEIERRWPEGFKVQVHLVFPPAKSVE